MKGVDDLLWNYQEKKAVRLIITSIEDFVNNLDDILHLHSSLIKM